MQAIIDGRVVSKIAFAKRTFERTDFPLRRVVRCGKCGIGLTGGWSTGKMGVKYAYYWCARKCNYKSIKVSDLEQALLSLLKDVSPKQECQNLFMLAWNYNGTLNSKISPLYQYIQTFGTQGVPCGAGEGSRTPDMMLGKQPFYR